MSDGYPFGADCDADAIRESWVVYWDDDGSILSESRVLHRYYVSQPAVQLGGKTPEYLDSSPQCRGDGATEPRGGAPTSDVPCVEYAPACTGAGNCTTTPHTHGCYADKCCGAGPYPQEPQ